MCFSGEDLPLLFISFAICWPIWLKWLFKLFAISWGFVIFCPSISKCFISVLVFFFRFDIVSKVLHSFRLFSILSDISLLIWLLKERCLTLFSILSYFLYVLLDSSVFNRFDLPNKIFLVLILVRIPLVFSQGLRKKLVSFLDSCFTGMYLSLRFWYALET